MKIDDGMGSGRSAGVTGDNRLATTSVTLTVGELVTHHGDSYTIDTGIITLTSSTVSGILYVKNRHQDGALVIDKLTVYIGKSTAGTGGDVVVQIYQNPTTGTLISGASVLSPGNRKLDDVTPALMAAYKGTEGNTITNGTVFQTAMRSDYNILEIPAAYVLPFGQAIAIAITPPASNTSMKVAVVILSSFLDDGDIQAGG